MSIGSIGHEIRRIRIAARGGRPSASARNVKTLRSIWPRLGRAVPLVAGVLVALSTAASGWCSTAGNGAAAGADAAWAEFDGTDYEVFCSRWQSGSWSARERLTRNEGKDLLPCIGAAADGRRWVVWTSVRGLDSDLCYAFFDGADWSAPAVVPTGFSMNTGPAMAVDDTGTPWVFWAGFDGRDDDIFCMSWIGSGWTEPCRVSADDGVPDTQPAAGVDEDGRPWVAWYAADEEEPRYRLVFSERTVDGWTAEQEADVDSFRALVQHAADACPARPRFVPNWDRASVHVRGRAGIQSLRPRDLEPDSVSEEPAGGGGALARASVQGAAGVKTILAFGDSITQGYPYVMVVPNGARTSGGYEPTLESLYKQYQGETVYVLNYGHGGEDTRHGIARFPGMLAANPGAHRVLIMEGTNDEWSGISYTTTGYNLAAMCESCLARGIDPVLANLTPSNRDPEKDIPLVFNPTIAYVAQEIGIRLCDQYSAFLSNWSKYSDDGLHPNRAGYQYMGQVWFGSATLPPQWAPVFRDIDGDRLLVQMADTAATEIWHLGPDGVSTNNAPLSDPQWGWYVKSLDDNRVLLQKGDGGPCRIWQLGPDGRPAGTLDIKGASLTGWIACSIDGNRLLLQYKSTGTCALWTIGPSGTVTARTWVTGWYQGAVARSLDGNRILAQLNDGGISGFCTVSSTGRASGWTLVRSSYPGWIVKALDGSRVLLQRRDAEAGGYWTLGPAGTPVSYTPIP